MKSDSLVQITRLASHKASQQAVIAWRWRFTNPPGNGEELSCGVTSIGLQYAQRAFARNAVDRNLEKCSDPLRAGSWRGNRWPMRLDMLRYWATFHDYLIARVFSVKHPMPNLSANQPLLTWGTADHTTMLSEPGTRKERMAESYILASMKTIP